MSELHNLPPIIKPPKMEQRESFFKSDHDPLSEGYFDEIRSRSFRKRTDADVETVVSLELSASPITQLTDEELQRLREYITESAQAYKRFINNIYGGLAEHQIYWINDILFKELKT